MIIVFIKDSSIIHICKLTYIDSMAFKIDVRLRPISLPGHNFGSCHINLCYVVSASPRCPMYSRNKLRKVQL